jgi:hypothetical protein
MTQEIIENKSRLKIVEVDDIPTICPRTGIYDEAITATETATKDTLLVQIEGKMPKQLYSGLHGRILAYNENPQRKYDMLLAQRKDTTFIKRCPKDSITKRETK